MCVHEMQLISEKKRYIIAQQDVIVCIDMQPTV